MSDLTVKENRWLHVALRPTHTTLRTLLLRYPPSLAAEINEVIMTKVCPL